MVNQDKVLCPIDKGLLVFDESAARPFRRHARFLPARFEEFCIASRLDARTAAGSFLLPGPGT